MVLTFESVDEIPKCDHSNKKLLSSIFLVMLFIMLHKVVLTFESVDEIPKCDHLNKKLLSSIFS